MSPRISGGAERPLETLRLTESVQKRLILNRGEDRPHRYSLRSIPSNELFAAGPPDEYGTVSPGRRLMEQSGKPGLVGGDEAARQSSAGQLSTVGERLSWKFNPAVVSFTTPARIR